MLCYFCENKCLTVDMRKLIEMTFIYIYHRFTINTSYLFFDNMLCYFDSTFVMNKNVISSFINNENFKGRQLQVVGGLKKLKENVAIVSRATFPDVDCLLGVRDSKQLRVWSDMSEKWRVQRDECFLRDPEDVWKL